MPVWSYVVLSGLVVGGTALVYAVWRIRSRHRAETAEQTIGEPDIHDAVQDLESTVVAVVAGPEHRRHAYTGQQLSRAGEAVAEDRIEEAGQHLRALRDHIRKD